MKLSIIKVQYQLVLLFCLIIINFGCKKEVSSDIDTSSLKLTLKDTFKDNEYGRESSISINDVNTWLSNQNNELFPRRNQILADLEINMLGDQMYTEPFTESENFIIVPIQQIKFSEHTDSINIPLQYLFLVENAEGEIRRGDLIFFEPTDEGVTELSDSSFYNFFTNQTLNTDGTLIFVSLDDVKQYEMDFAYGIPTEHRLWEGKTALNEAEGEEIYCTQYTLVITTYYTDGTTTVEETDLGIICNSEGTGGGGGGGGGGNTTPPPAQIGVPVTRELTFVVAFKNTNSRYFMIQPSYTVGGMRFNNASLNTFNTTPPQLGSSAFFYLAFNFNGMPGTPWYAKYKNGTNSWTLSNDYRSATAYFQGLVNYPQQPGLGTELYHKHNTFQASIALI